MANDITTRVWKLDTAGATKIWEGRVYIKLVKWFNPTAIGDLMTLTDQNDVEILAARAEVANGSQVFNLENWYNGLKLSVLTAGGIAYVHVK